MVMNKKLNIFTSIAYCLKTYVHQWLAYSSTPIAGDYIRLSSNNRCVIYWGLFTSACLTVSVFNSN